MTRVGDEKKPLDNKSCFSRGLSSKKKRREQLNIQNLDLKTGYITPHILGKFKIMIEVGEEKRQWNKKSPGTGKWGRLRIGIKRAPRHRRWPQRYSGGRGRRAERIGEGRSKLTITWKLLLNHSNERGKKDPLLSAHTHREFDLKFKIIRKSWVIRSGV